MPSRTTATVKLFLVHGDPTSVLTAEISNWTGKAVTGPRSEFDELLARPEAENPGAYFLSGISPETGRPRVYIGEAEVIRKRLRSHLDKDFWNTATYFVSKDENLTKAHILYLEGQLIERAREIGRYEVENKSSSGARLSEADSAEMDVYLEKVIQLLPVLGLTFAKPLDDSTVGASDVEILTCAIKDVMAKGRQTRDGLLVYSGSQAVLEERPSTQKYPYAANIRAQLRSEGVLSEAAGKLVFARDYEFSSPSAAAAVIHGGQANGLTAWVDSEGRSLKDRESEEVAEIDAGDLD